MMSRSISQTTAAISQITTAITTTVMIKLNAPRTLLTSSQLKSRDNPKDTLARWGLDMHFRTAAERVTAECLWERVKRRKGG
jgi:hypothetical protein